MTKILKNIFMKFWKYYFYEILENLFFEKIEILFL